MITQAFLALLLDGRDHPRRPGSRGRPGHRTRPAGSAAADRRALRGEGWFRPRRGAGYERRDGHQAALQRIAASRLSDALVRPRQQPRPTANTEDQPFGSAAANPAMPASKVRHRAELPLSIPGLPDTLERTTRRTALRSETALAPVSPTVPVPR